MILFIDDEKRFADSYICYLRDISQFNIDMAADVDEAIDRLNKDNNDIELVVMDIMMPPGNVFKGIDTKKGLRTGQFLYEKIRDSHPNLPIVVFTNVSDPDAKEIFKDDKLCKFMEKPQYNLKDFSNEIKAILSSQLD
jgi:CheY-like chemotaxis protein